MTLKGIICERLKTDETFFTDGHPYFTTRSEVILPEVAIPLTANFDNEVIGFIMPDYICDDGDYIKFKAIVTDESAKSWLKFLNNIYVGGYYTNVVASDEDSLKIESAKLMAISICKEGFYKAEVDDNDVFNTRPKKLPKKLDYDNYRYAICRCPVDTSHALIIPKQYNRFRCISCGLEGVAY